MQFLNPKATIPIALGLLSASFTCANPVPELERRITCTLNAYIFACCSYIEYVSWPNIVPGESGGCVTMASQPGGICPTSGASTAGCCQSDSPFNRNALGRYADGSVYCYTP